MALSAYVSSAIEFSSQAAVEIGVRLDEDAGLDERVRHCIDVRDEGEEVDPAVAERLFCRFKQADSSATRRHGGVGSGLVRVREIAERMGGTAGMTVPDGPGNEFWFTVRLHRR